MPDRVTGEDLTLRVDTGSTTGPVTVTVTESTGEEVGTATASEIGGGHWTADVSVGSYTNEGLWTATWDTPSGEIEQEFTVGPGGYLSKHAVQVRALSRIGESYWGQLSYHDSTQVVDPNLYGGSGDYVGYWFVPSADSDAAGMPRRVKAYNGSSLTLSEAYPFTLPSGTRYLLVRDVSPFEVDDALDEIVATLRRREYPKLHASGLSIEDYSESLETAEVEVPLGWDYVTGVYLTDSDGDEEEHPPSKWSMIPERRIFLKNVCDDETTVRLYGARDPRSSVWEDSLIDINPSIVIPALAHRLHVARARGSSTDPDEHIRRTVMSYQEFEDAARRFRARVPRNLREVLT